MTIEELNLADRSEARRVLHACCGCVPWVDRMLAARPFGSLQDALASADRIWNALPPEDWRSTFASHPRIGESRSPHAPGGDLAVSWSAREQAAAADSDAVTRSSMARCNADYEKRFGYRYLVFASGRSATELLTDCESRLMRDPEVEILHAAGELAKITRLRLTRLLHTEEP
jgi:2-oxo-4-hydroxy-4-carboxy-5-ureidoimidazoline decarboxylase